MKNLKFGLLTMILAIVSLSFTGCGDDEKDEPKPTKTNLELVKEGVLGTWNFVSAEITKDGITKTYTGGCNFTGEPTWYQANAIDSDYTFLANGKANILRNCSNQNFLDLTYTVTELNGKFTITVSDGGIFELLTTVNDIDGNNVKVKVSPLMQGASSNTLTFSK